MKKQKQHIVIAGGGTGGHVFPGIAIAESITAMDPTATILFVGTKQGVEQTTVPKAGFAFQTIDVAGLKGKSVFTKLKSLLKLPTALWQSVQILKKQKATAVIGTGGYVSGPVLLAAFLLRIPSAIFEPNGVTGFTNRLLGRLVQRVFASFESTRADFPSQKYILSGTPLRHAVTQTKRKPTSPPLVAIFGGSLGASAINTVVPDALALVAQKNPSVQIIHQTGQREADQVKNRYQGHHLQAEVLPFIDDVASVYAKCHLVVARSGAMTCAELLALGIPAILIPFPFAIDDHQTKNAKALEQAGLAQLIPEAQLNPHILSQAILKYIDNTNLSDKMSLYMVSFGKNNASAQIAEAALKQFQ